MARPKRSDHRTVSVGVGRRPGGRKPGRDHAGDTSRPHDRIVDAARHDTTKSDHLPAAYVEWLDVVRWPGQQEHKTGLMALPGIIRSVGHLVRDDSTGVILAQDQNHWDGQVRSLLKIPRHAVIELRMLRLS